MSAEWTEERLDALPEGTTIEWTEAGARVAIRMDDGEWWLPKFSGPPKSSKSVVKAAGSRPGSIRVVSVPIDALLADETCNAGADVLSPTGEWWAQSQARYVLRAAVEHVTGEAT